MGVPALAIVLRVKEGFRQSDIELSLLSISKQDYIDYSVTLYWSSTLKPVLESFKQFLPKGVLLEVEVTNDLNRLISTQKSHYISFVDCGQVLLSNAYSALIQDLEATSSGMSFCGVSIVEYDCVNNVYLKVRECENASPCRSVADLWQDRVCPLLSCAFNREQLVREQIAFWPSLGALSDYQFILLASTRLRASFQLSDQKLVQYRIVNSVADVLATPSMARNQFNFNNGLKSLQKLKLTALLGPSVQATLSGDSKQTIALYLSQVISKTDLKKTLYSDQIVYSKRSIWKYLWDKISGRHSVIKKSERTLLNVVENDSFDLLTGVSDELGKLDLYQTIAESGLFDSRYYLKEYSDSWSNGVAPLRHYIVWGGLEGRTPSPSFDSKNYTEANPDISTGKVVPLAHYIETGTTEGRPMYPQQFEIERSLRNFISKREKVLLVSHDGSRTGAPMVAYNLLLHLQKDYDVIMLFLGDGPLVEASRQIGAQILGPVKLSIDSPTAVGLIFAIAKLARPRFAIVNSVASRLVIPPLFAIDVPIITLVHEFAADTRPIGAFLEAVQGSSSTVFSTTLAIDNMLEFHPELRGRIEEFPLIPQGQCYIPRDKNKKISKGLTSAGLGQPLKKTGITVVGLGTIYYRKGVDLFLDCAFRIKRDYPGLNVRFLWVGSYVHGEPSYRMFIEDQIKRAGLTDSIQFISQLDSLDAVYKEADLLLLSSRLDPLPNVAIDALLRGVPCLVFERTTGIADLLRKHGLEGFCVAPYLDTAVMAAKIAALVESAHLRREIGTRSQVAAAEMFSATKYCQQIVDLAEKHVARNQERADEVEEITAARIINPDFVCGLNTEKEMAAAYLRASKVWYAKPFPGFHPGVYRELNSLKGPLDHDPLIEFLRAGRPSGPWLQRVITPESDIGITKPIRGRVALHIHAFYPEMLPSILDRVDRNESKMDLLISVPSKEAFLKTESCTKNFRKGSVTIKQVVNKGRDIGPFLTAFQDEILTYDIIGHIHTKKSFHADKNMIQRWVYALMENTLGGLFPMADKILHALDNDQNLGMIFPEDPNCHPWGSSYSKGQALASKMNLPPPTFEINFPVGTMFWARVEALRPLFNLGLTWEDYPEEPVPIDGTILHAIERLLPLVVQSTGKTVAVTYVPRVSRLR